MSPHELQCVGYECCSERLTDRYFVGIGELIDSSIDRSDWQEI